MSLEIPRALLEEVWAHCREAYPNECCGLLVGQLGAISRVQRVCRARNLNALRPWDRYELDASDFLRVNREAAAEDRTVLGCYHSHPDHPALPSATDAQLACPDFSYMIVSVREGRPAETRSWLFSEPAAARYDALRASAPAREGGEPPGVFGFFATDYVLFGPVRRGEIESRAAVRETFSRVVTEESLRVV